MSRAVELRDLRSLDRPSLYRIFAPLDPDERLPRELLMESRRHRLVGRPEVAAALWLPTLWVILFATVEQVRKALLDDTRYSDRP